MFLGTYSPKLDDKGRLFLPAKWRDQLAGGLVITKGQENCLYVFPQADFAVMGATLRNAPVTAKTMRDHSRVFFSSASDEIPDKQGRITVPVPLRTYAGLDKECIALGVNDRVEIWDVAAHTAWLAESERAFSENADEVMPGVF